MTEPSVLKTGEPVRRTRDTDSWSAPQGEAQRINPMLRVPVLVDGEQTLLDSKLMAAYLYDRYPQAPLPPPPGHLPLQATLWHPQHRFDDENTLLAMDTAVDSTINLFLLELDGIAAEPSAYLRRQQQRVRACLGWVDGKLAGRTSFHDGVIAQLDIALVCALQWMQFRKRYPVEDHPNLVQFLAAHASRPSLAETHPSRAQNTAPPHTPGR